MNVTRDADDGEPRVLVALLDVIMKRVLLGTYGQHGFRVHERWQEEMHVCHRTSSRAIDATPSTHPDEDLEDKTDPHIDLQRLGSGTTEETEYEFDDGS